MSMVPVFRKGVSSLRTSIAILLMIVIASSVTKECRYPRGIKEVTYEAQKVVRSRWYY